jgi:hypothetical protein
MHLKAVLKICVLHCELVWPWKKTYISGECLPVERKWTGQSTISESSRTTRSLYSIIAHLSHIFQREVFGTEDSAARRKPLIRCHSTKE